MSLILQIETATASCSVALANEGKLLAVKEINARNVHAEVITLFIDELVRQAGTNYNSLDAVAVSCGPGSYTGLRIGVSTAKGLCFALDKPLIAVDTLEAMAAGVMEGKIFEPVAGRLFCPMIDARRMEVFTAIFNRDGQKIKPTAAEIIDENSFAGLLKNHEILFFGDGAEKCKIVLDIHPNVRFLPGFVNSAAYLTKSAFEKFRDKNFEDVAYFEPYYLKEFVAGKKAV
ncbi:MAG: tsaB [Mucilaginibacter sp.]|nr:tsaB [Mucilaginibacter sp.]